MNYWNPDKEREKKGDLAKSVKNHKKETLKKMVPFITYNLSTLDLR